MEMSSVAVYIYAALIHTSNRNDLPSFISVAAKVYAWSPPVRHLCVGIATFCLWGLVVVNVHNWV